MEDVNHKFITDYEFYIKTEFNCAHNTTIKYLKNLKKIIRIALANDDISKDPFARIKFSLTKVDREVLSNSEVQSIINKEFTIERLSQVRDFFIFACFTFLALIHILVNASCLQGEALSVGNDLETIELPYSALVFNLSNN